MTLYEVTPHAGRGKYMERWVIDAPTAAEAIEQVELRLEAAGTPYRTVTARVHPMDETG